MATETVLVEENHHTFSLVDQDPHVAFLVTVISKTGRRFEYIGRVHFHVQNKSIL